jgi:hypothetical protein
MKKLVIAAAALLIGGVMSSAQAEWNVGSVQGQGQCWVGDTPQGAQGFGYWAACPQPVKVAVKKKVHVKK